MSAYVFALAIQAERSKASAGPPISESVIIDLPAKSACDRRYIYNAGMAVRGGSSSL
jgi:hypothetical protein